MGGFVMPRKYRHIKDYEKELIEYIEQGHTLRENRGIFNFEYKEMRDSKQDTTKIKRNLRQE